MENDLVEFTVLSQDPKVLNAFIEAGNKSMAAGGRAQWNEEDGAVAYDAWVQASLSESNEAEYRTKTRGYFTTLPPDRNHF